MHGSERCYSQPLQSQRSQPPLLPPEQSLCAGIPIYSSPGQAVHAEKAVGAVGSCLKALQPAASGRYDQDCGAEWGSCRGTSLIWDVPGCSLYWDLSPGFPGIWHPH